MLRLSFGLAMVLILGLTTPANAATLSVGPARTYTSPCAAFAAARDGDVIEIDSAGNYDGDVCAVTKNQLQIRGTGTGRAHIDAAGKNAQGKAIWVVQGNDTVIENIEFSGATVPDNNGAGIRQEGKNLTVRNCAFRDNQDGILAGDVAGSEIVIEYSEFDHNGAGDGYSHNLYINHVAKLTFRYNYSHRAVIGHLLKSRAAENYILYNRLSGEADGSQSYEIDCPNGGKTFIIGNVIEQGTPTDNPSMLSYLAEGVHPSNPSLELYVINNTFVNHLGRGTFINVGQAASTPAVIENNIFYGGGTLCTQPSAILSTNLEGGGDCFVGDATFDYRLRAGSPCKNAGTAPQAASGYSLVPVSMYQHPAQSEARPIDGALDLGAFEETSGNAGASGAGGNGASTSGTVNGGASAGASNGIAGGTVNAQGGGFATQSTPATSGDAADAGCSCRLGRHNTGERLPFTWLLVAGLGLCRRARRVSGPQHVAAGASRRESKGR